MQDPKTKRLEVNKECWEHFPEWIRPTIGVRISGANYGIGSLGSGLEKQAGPGPNSLQSITDAVTPVSLAMGFFHLFSADKIMTLMPW